jgi:hypothetical protein
MMNVKICRRNSKNSENAQGMVEFALILPLLLLLVLGIIEMGRVMFYYISVTSSAREAARYGAAAGSSTSGVPFYQDCDGIRAAALRIGTFAGVDATAADVHIFYDDGPSATPVDIDSVPDECPEGGTGPTLVIGKDKVPRIVVSVRGNYEPIAGLAPIPSMTIKSVSKRTLLLGVTIP